MKISGKINPRPVRRWLTGLLLVGAICPAAVAGSGTSTSYSIPADTIDSGGRHAASAAYSNDGSIGNVAGISTAGVSGLTVTSGYIAQLSGPAPVITGTLTASGTSGSAISTYTIAATNSPVSYSATGLPAGLSLDIATGVISGTPTVVGTFLVTLDATNGAGTSSATLTLTVNDAAPTSLTFSANPATYTKGSAITSNAPSHSGGAVVSYSVSPSLPAGLSLNTGTGMISGTPTALASATGYTVTATNSGGSTTVTVTITVNDVAPSALTYSNNPAVYAKSQAIVSNTPSSTGGAVVSYSVSPSLPAGLSLNAGTGVISGTLTALASATGYTVTATNSGGSTTATVTITVNDVAPSALTYSNNPAVYAKSQAIANNTPSSTGGAVVSYAVSPSLPAGLSLNTGTGVISGVPTAIAAQASYTVTATNSGGSTTATLTLTVVANFLSWQQAKFTAGELADPNLSGPNAVYGLDGLPNLVKYALGLEPKVNTVTGTPTLTETATDWVYAYTKPTEVTDATYTAQVSTDLATWTATGVPQQQVGVASGVESWEAHYPLSSAVNVYFRLRIQRGPDTSFAPPLGGMTITVPTGQTRSIAVPLLHWPAGTGAVFGRLSGVGTSFIDATGANWSPGSYSAAANPYYLRLRTGSAAGRLFLVTTTANTATQLFLNNEGTDLAQANLTTGTSGDVYELILADTLGSLFGSNTLQGGTNATVADDVMVWGGASWLTFYYNTTNGRWQRNTDTVESPTQSTFVLRPDRGVMIVRKGATNLKFYVTGRVPDVAPTFWHQRPGVTFLSAGLPVDQTLGALGLQTRATGWQGGASNLTAGANADLIQVWGGASWLTFYYDTTNARWQRDTDTVASPTRNTFVIPAGRPIMIRRLTAPATADDSLIPLPLPYSLPP